MSTAIARMGILDEPGSLTHARELAEVLSRSELLVPAHLRGKPADILLALSMAQLLNQPALVVLQAIYVVGGKPGWSASFVIGLANNSGVFKGPIDWREKGEGESLEVTAFATLQDGREVSYTVTMKMAKDEGWTRNSKYKTLGTLMLRYRSATLLVRLYAPGVLMGLQTVEELRDVAAASGVEEYVVEPQQEQRPRPQLEQRPDGVTVHRDEQGRRVPGEVAKVGSPEPTLPREKREPRKEEPKREEPKTEQVQGAHTSWPEDESGFRKGVEALGLDFETVCRLAVTRPGATRPEMMGQVRRSKYLKWLDEPEGRAAYEDFIGAEWGEEQLIQAAEYAESLGGPTNETVIKCAQAAGLPIQDGMPYTDGAPIPMLRRFFHYLRDQSRRVGA